VAAVTELASIAKPERNAMLRAIDLADLGLGRTSPNPIVGCVVLDADGATAGEGFHARAGGPHAEVVALRAAGDRARGGTAVVTLEPCRHTGRTGPCTEALIEAGIARVMFAVMDPGLESGGGAAVLRDAGVDVEGGLLAAEAATSNEAWLHRVRTGRPFVTWKYAATLDGRVAAADGSSRWITGEPARADVHRLRSQSDAIVVGTGTVLADDPQLTVRGVDVDKQPLRVVVGRREIPASARILDDEADTVVLSDHAPGDVLVDLAARDVVSVLLEGGPVLAASFIGAGLVDRVIGYVAPALLGAGQPLLAPLGIETIADTLRLRVDDLRLVGADVRITARPHRPAATATAGE
jgi:diaminohydroxyphosphoribosylaminopyrimidine deaminase/5-amino-6-(5-phosphoribosylamino)uracil reductase